MPRKEKKRAVRARGRGQMLIHGAKGGVKKLITTASSFSLL